MSYATHIHCANCGIEFCLPIEVKRARLEDHGSFYCPNGHVNYYPQETAKEREIRQLKQQLEQTQWLRDSKQRRIDALEREVRSLRSKLAWARKREAA